MSLLQLPPTSGRGMPLPQRASHFVAGETGIQTKQMTLPKPQRRRGAQSVLCVVGPQSLELCLACHTPLELPCRDLQIQAHSER